MTKKQPAPAKKRTSVSAKITDDVRWMLSTIATEALQKRIDRSIRAAVQETWFACNNYENEASESHKAKIKARIETRFGVKL